MAEIYSTMKASANQLQNSGDTIAGHWAYLILKKKGFSETGMSGP